ncbi:MAG: glucose 1-dehydrogenase [Candidatus Tectimicrobiota bacterium]
MKAVAVVPGRKGSAHLREVPVPPAGAGQVLVRVLQVGLDGTDTEISEGLYGEAPPGDDYLIIGHESLGRVEEVGSDVSDLGVGDLVVATVRRPGGCLNCRAGQSDMCLDGDYTERGIKGAHGFLADYYVEGPEHLVTLPADYESVGVLLEPTTIAEKGIIQSLEIQRRMAWEPQRAVVLGAGPLGLLATALLRNMGLEAYTVARAPAGSGSLRQRVLEELGATYLSSRDHPVSALGRELGRIDLIFEATGHSGVVFEAMQALGVNGVLCLTGVTGGEAMREVPADKINLEVVLGNKVIFGSVNANRRYFELGATHLGEIRSKWPGLLERFITQRLSIEEYEKGLHRPKDDIKTVVELGS